MYGLLFLSAVPRRREFASDEDLNGYFILEEIQGIVII